MDQVEKYIMTRLYKSVFCPETTDDEKKDLATQKRIRCDSWGLITSCLKKNFSVGVGFFLSLCTSV